MASDAVPTDRAAILENIRLESEPPEPAVAVPEHAPEPDSAVTVEHTDAPADETKHEGEPA